MVYKEGVLVDRENIVVIIDMPPPTSINMMCATLGKRRYYSNFIRNYTMIIKILENIIKKDTQFIWKPDC
jgi:hypothetical protein